MEATIVLWYNIIDTTLKETIDTVIEVDIPYTFTIDILYE